MTLRVEYWAAQLDSSRKTLMNIEEFASEQEAILSLLKDGYQLIATDVYKKGQTYAIITRNAN